MKFEGRDAEAIQQLQEGQARVQAQVAEILVQLQKLQPPAPQPPAAGGPATPSPASAAQPPSLEVTLALMQQGIQALDSKVEALDSKVQALDSKIEAQGSKVQGDIKALDNKLVWLMVAVAVLSTVMGIKVFPFLRS